MKRYHFFLGLCLLCLALQAQQQGEPFTFTYDGVKLDGVLNLPTEQRPKGLVLIVHGSGQTNAVAQNWYSDVRELFVSSGYTVYMWDKMGCGTSEGVFDYNQTVQSSADEVLAAIAALQEKQVPGADKIGLWGISRAGWINPLVINQYPDIKFWISVSGVDGKESFGYLLIENLRINGLQQDSIDLILAEWKAGNRIMHAGGSYEECLAATTQLRKNSFLRRFNNHQDRTAEDYYNYQRTFSKEIFDYETDLHVVIPDFSETLAQVDCPVLALFGEQDKHVNWRKTKALYERTLNDEGQLTIATFPSCNHNLYQCETGGFYEFQDNQLPRNRCDGFLEKMAAWLVALKD